MDIVSPNIKIRPVPVSRRSEIDMDHIPFGKAFSDHMLVARYENGKWQEPEILPYGPMEFAPSISALNYGQAVFEGMKAHKGPNGEVLLFRPEENFKRMNYSAYRLAMPAIPEEIFLDGIRELVKLDQAWVPNPDQGALYLRPLYFAVDEYIGVKASDSYIFTVFTCPVGAYYKEPVKLLVTKDFIRAATGGTGAAKAAGNYASALLPDKLAKDQGYHNVLWLDGRNQEFIEECGTMNIFFVLDDKVLTPRLSGTILPGITRNSVIRLLEDKGYEVEARPISIYELQQAYREKRLKEAFGTGTAATISHIDTIGFAGEDWKLPHIEDRKIGPWLSERLVNLRTGLVEDPYGWVQPI